MSDFYNPSVSEPKWQKKWEEAGVFKTDLMKAKKPFYSLVMFPYPSGDKLHVGHWYNYAPADTYARYRKMQGADIFSPMGFDAFGLPAENYAIKTGVHPAESTEKNIRTMITQLKRIGCMYDWNKMVNTTDPSYYRWTQWLFLEMFKHDLAYKKLGNVNWCPVDQTVLANEQVWDGKCERCGSDVIQKPLSQWYWKITRYVQALLDGLSTLDWPHKTKVMQQNWIGRSEGCDIRFVVDEKYRGVIGPMHWQETSGSRRIYSPEEMSGSRRIYSPEEERIYSPEEMSGSRRIYSPETGSQRIYSPETGSRRIYSPEEERIYSPEEMSGSQRIYSPETGSQRIYSPEEIAATSAVAGGLNRRLPRRLPEGRAVLPGKERFRCVHIVFSPRKRAHSFDEPANAEHILRILDSVAQRHDIILHEAAAMPDHVHLLVSFDSSRDLNIDVSKKLKGASAHEYLKDYEDDRRLWGEGLHHENIDSLEQFTAVLRYIQLNPSKANLEPKGRILSQLQLQVSAFTTTVDTVYGVTFVVIAPDHPLLVKLVSLPQKAAVDLYVKESVKKSEFERQFDQEEKTGVFTGANVVHPFTGEKIPLWIADYVLMSYGTGVVMGVPAHDQRDMDFAKKYRLPVVQSIQSTTGESIVYDKIDKYSVQGTIINSGAFTGMSILEGRKKIIENIEKAFIGRGKILYRLRDWLVSRQRYWGAPIPIVYDPEGKAHPIPEEHLPWLLPTDVAFKPTGTSPLTDSKEFIARTEKIFGKGWRPEFDTMDTFVCSSFYYLRYLMQESSRGKNQIPISNFQKNSQFSHSSLRASGPRTAILNSQFVDPTLEKKWLPVSMYIGGPEHACMHLIYARFVMMALKDFGHTSHSEPFKKLVHQGLITNRGAKMSKSKDNVVSPDSFVWKYGSDVFRMYLMFMGPFEAGGDWSDTGIKGIVRFVDRLWKSLSLNKKLDHDTEPVQAALHRTIKKVGEDIAVFHFNTAISALMELLNLIDKEGGCSKETARTIALLLGPLAPHLADELWSELGQKGFVIKQKWPAYDPALIVEMTMTIVVQVNGKIRGDITVSKDAMKEEILSLAKANENVQKYIAGGIRKEIYIAGKLVSLVV